MSSSNIKSLLKIIFVLCITEAFLSVLHRYYFLELDDVFAFSIHIFLLISITSLIFNQWLLKSASYVQQSTQNISDFYKYAIDQHSIVAITDVKGEILDVNDKFCEISGYNRNELIGQSHQIINSGVKDKTYWKEMYRTVANGENWKDEVMNKAKDGSYYWVDTTIIPLMNEQNKPQCYISIRTDITQQKHIQKAFENVNKQLTRMCLIDELTGISNRRAYDENLNSEVQSAQRSHQPLSMLIIDIDDFKLFNDKYGHDFGDQVLKHIATTINDSLPRITDFVARYGGEEFIVIMPSTNNDGAYQVAKRIHNNIRNSNTSIAPINHESPLTVSIDISTLSGFTLDKNMLFKQADTALYEAKGKGKNTTVIFNQNEELFA